MTRPQTRIDRRFAALKDDGRAGLVTYFMAGDPDLDTTARLLNQLPGAGADIIELGMPFSDPMADGPAIQAAGQRSLAAGTKLADILQVVREFRRRDKDTPVVLMGYYNPIYVYPPEKFLGEAAAAGVDGLIIVDMPPEADDELCLPAMKHGLNFIRLATPTTDEARLPAVLANTSGFLYYVSVAGVTGTVSANPLSVQGQVRRIRARTTLPIVVGFGLRTPAQVRQIAQGADGVVIGTAIVEVMAKSLTAKGKASRDTIPSVLNLVRGLADAVRG